MSGPARKPPRHRPVSKDEPAGGPRRGAGSYRAAPCPVCAKMSIFPHHPFCSPRCRDIDLHRWLGGHYVVPAQDDDQDG